MNSWMFISVRECVDMKACLRVCKYEGFILWFLQLFSITVNAFLTVTEFIQENWGKRPTMLVSLEMQEFFRTGGLCRTVQFQFISVSNFSFLYCFKKQGVWASTSDWGVAVCYWGAEQSVLNQGWISVIKLISWMRFVFVMLCLERMLLGVRGVWPACWCDVAPGKAVWLLVLVAMACFGTTFLQWRLEQFGDLNQHSKY